jgi:hypothetical protein
MDFSTALAIPDAVMLFPDGILSRALSAMATFRLVPPISMTRMRFMAVT